MLIDVVHVVIIGLVCGEGATVSSRNETYIISSLTGNILVILCSELVSNIAKRIFLLFTFYYLCIRLISSLAEFSRKNSSRAASQLNVNQDFERYYFYRKQYPQFLLEDTVPYSCHSLSHPLPSCFNFEKLLYI